MNPEKREVQTIELHSKKLKRDLARYTMATVLGLFGMVWWMDNALIRNLSAGMAAIGVVGVLVTKATMWYEHG